jgi:hypothetical protein
MKYAASVILSGICSLLLVTLLSTEARAYDGVYSDRADTRIVADIGLFAADTSQAGQSSDEIPASFGLHQNYPNPFNPTTSIKYDVAARAHVQLVVYDMLGKQVATLVDQNQSPGTYRVTFNASRLTSGVYILSMKADDFTAVRRMVLTK